MQYVTKNVSINVRITTRIKISCNCIKFLYIMSKTTNCSKTKVHYIQYCSLLQKVIRKAKEMYYNELLLSTNKSKTSWNIISNEICTASSKKFTQTKFKLGNKNISTNQSAKIFNNNFIPFHSQWHYSQGWASAFFSYFINSINDLNKLQQKTESALFSYRVSFPYEFPQIISIPIWRYCAYNFSYRHNIFIKK